MNKFLVLLACVGFVAAEPQIGISATSYRYQDELGQHAFGHVGGPNSREEVKTADGITRGSYSYVDGHGLVQSAVYTADGAGFRVAATNLPVGPAVPAAPAVLAASPVIAARSVLGASIIPGAGLIHSLKKRSVLLGSPLAYTTAIHPGSLNVPLDTPIVAHAKAASLIQQNTEGIRNNLGGIPLALPADTPEVAAGKIAHSIAHARQSLAVAPVWGSPLAHVLKKRSVLLASPLAYTTAIHPGSLNVPLDTPIVAHAKAASLIQQNTEGIRNNFGGIPLALPADTPEVAAGKIAHSIAHARQSLAVAPVWGSPLAHVLKKRSVLLASPLAYTTAIHPGSLNVPLDEPIVAHAKVASLVQQNTEGIRNNLGGIPLALPADTPEVAAGKIAHSIAHARQTAIAHSWW